MREGQHTRVSAYDPALNLIIRSIGADPAGVLVTKYRA